MRFDEAYSGKVFLLSKEDWDSCNAVIYGMPIDFTASFRPGSRFGPARIREASLVLEEYSPYLDRHLEEVRYFDAGDIPLPFGNVGRSLGRIEENVDRMLQEKKFPLGLGGEHLVTWPIVRALCRHFSDLAVIHIDAHADLRETYEGEALSHATPIRKICEYIGAENVFSFGIRSGAREEFLYARKAQMHLSRDEVYEPLKEILPRLRGRNVYVTIDIDVLDPAHAPGTGTAEPGGITTKELLKTVHLLAEEADCRIAGADVVEVAPVYDPSEQTAITAAKLVREILLGWVKKSPFDLEE